MSSVGPPPPTVQPTLSTSTRPAPTVAIDPALPPAFTFNPRVQPSGDNIDKDFTGSSIDGAKIGMYVGIAVGVLAFIALAVWGYSKYKKSKESTSISLKLTEVEENKPYAGGYPSSQIGPPSNYSESMGHVNSANSSYQPASYNQQQMGYSPQNSHSQGYRN
jgi:hypothetical protein